MIGFEIEIPLEINLLFAISFSSIVKNIFGFISLNLIPNEAVSGEDAEVGINRVLDRLRKGIDAIAALKAMRKLDKRQVVEVSKWRFWRKKRTGA